MRYDSTAGRRTERMDLSANAGPQDTIRARKARGMKRCGMVCVRRYDALHHRHSPVYALDAEEDPAGLAP